MEGLIPMVFKAIKNNKTRRQYRCLSTTGGAQAYNLVDFYNNNNNTRDDDDDRVHDYGFTTPSRKVESGGIHENRGHRRHQSYGGEGGYTNGGNRYEGHECGEVNDVSFYDPNNKQQLKRFRSHRMFAFAGC